MARANAFWPTAVVGEADSVNSVSASACHIGGPKGINPGQKALLHGSKSGLRHDGYKGQQWDIGTNGDVPADKKVRTFHFSRTVCKNKFRCYYMTISAGQKSQRQILRPGIEPRIPF